MRQAINLSKAKDFVAIFRIFGIYAIEDILLRYCIAPLTHLISGTRKLDPLPKLIDQLLNEKRFLLIILDACRYDIFSKIYHKYLGKGTLKPALSKGSFLREWIPEIFNDFRWQNTRIFRVRLRIKPHDLSLVSLIKSKSAGMEIFEVEPPRGMLTMPPDMFVNYVLKVGLVEKNVVWFMQPHYPWIAYEDLSLKVLKEVMLYEFLPGSIVSKMLHRKNIDKYDLIKAYISNLLIVLKEVRRLIEYYKEVYNGVVVVTSDHGELLGEFNLWFHHPSHKVPQLVIVPWLEVRQ